MNDLDQYIDLSIKFDRFGVGKAGLRPAPIIQINHCVDQLL